MYRANRYVRSRTTTMLPGAAYFLVNLSPGTCKYDITLSVSLVASFTASLLRAMTPATRP